MAFRRFYFVSANDLFDILSKDCNPKEIKQHFGKTYYNLVKITWKNDEIVVAMQSREKKEVLFVKPLVLTEAIEI
jgi:hypothetical protein